MRTNHNASGKPSLEGCAGLRYLPSVGITSHIPLGVWYFDSAFYQLFDEGIYEDHNYKVVVNKAIIVCTSNYKTIDEIKEHLGLPIYNRFDSIIKFDDLPDMAKEKIAEREIERLKKDYDIEDRELFDKIKEGAVTQSNAREIKHLIKETFSLVALKKICGETEI